jgi:hypothetical protein
VRQGSTSTHAQRASWSRDGLYLSMIRVVEPGRAKGGSQQADAPSQVGWPRGALGAPRRAPNAPSRPLGRVGPRRVLRPARARSTRLGDRPHGHVVCRTPEVTSGWADGRVNMTITQQKHTGRRPTSVRLARQDGGFLAAVHGSG